MKISLLCALPTTIPPPTCEFVDASDLKDSPVPTTLLVCPASLAELRTLTSICLFCGGTYSFHFHGYGWESTPHVSIIYPLTGDIFMVAVVGSGPTTSNWTFQLGGCGPYPEGVG